ncbi:MAG: endonuclease/exonuclease/phosphatase family protein [Arcobacter sp.]|uniref:endonuclease/exonuclease/phosphatase family protein n=1 Tax=Arcobacter sp. TaxID=1872629 RepID=UPI003B0010F0
MILRLLILILFLYNFSFSKDFTVASYNVENFFDLKYDKTEYKEFIPNTKAKWYIKTYTTKLNNILKVLNDLDKDIIALQEIESNEAFKDIIQNLPQYKYSIFKKYKSSSIGLALLSKYEIIDYELLDVKHSKVNRPILKVAINIDNNKLIIFNNHWPSKRKEESQRILYAQAIEDNIKNLDDDIDYIILGDLNSNYNEFETFKYSKLNNTYNLTGINDVLNTRNKNNYVSIYKILSEEKRVHYNLWLQLNYPNRFSYKYRGQNGTPDNILLPKAMFDDKNISYVNNSFDVFKPKYLINNNKIFRWEIKNKVHTNKGYSDHLPIFATFSTSKQPKIEVDKVNFISELYTQSNLTYPVVLKDITLLYKTSEIAIIKQKNNRAIFVYKNVDNLEYDKLYTIKIDKIKEFNGLLEIVGFTISKSQASKLNKQSLYLDASKHDIQKNSFQNEIITNITGNIKGKYFHYIFKNEKKKIRVYSKNRKLLPNNGQKITIINAHLGFYKSKPQIIIYKKSDYKYVD